MKKKFGFRIKKDKRKTHDDSENYEEMLSKEPQSEQSNVVVDIDSKIDNVKNSGKEEGADKENGSNAGGNYAKGNNDPDADTLSWWRKYRRIFAILTAVVTSFVWFLERYINPDFDIRFVDPQEIAEYRRTTWKVEIIKYDWLIPWNYVKHNSVINDDFKWSLYEREGEVAVNKSIASYKEEGEYYMKLKHYKVPIDTGDYKLLVKYSDLDPISLNIEIRHPRASSSFEIKKKYGVGAYSEPIYLLDKLDAVNKDQYTDTIRLEGTGTFVFQAKSNSADWISEYLWDVKGLILKKGTDYIEVDIAYEGLYNILLTTVSDRGVKNTNNRLVIVGADSQNVNSKNSGGLQQSTNSGSVTNRGRSERVTNTELGRWLSSYANTSDMLALDSLETLILETSVSDKIMINRKISLASFLIRLKMLSEPSIFTRVQVLNLQYDDLERVQRIRIKPINGIIE